MDLLRVRAAVHVVHLVPRASGQAFRMLSYNCPRACEVLWECRDMSVRSGTAATHASAMRGARTRCYALERAGGEGPRARAFIFLTTTRRGIGSQMPRVQLLRPPVLTPQLGWPRATRSRAPAWLVCDASVRRAQRDRDPTVAAQLVRFFFRFAIEAAIMEAHAARLAEQPHDGLDEVRTTRP